MTGAEPRAAAATGSAEFFTGLGERGRQPQLARAQATVRVDLTTAGGVEHWYLTLDRGEVTVSHQDGPADCVMRAERDTFDQVARGELNAMAAMLRNEVTFEGNPVPIVLLQRLLPSPAATKGYTDES